MRTLLSENLRSEPFPNPDGKFIDCWESGNQGNTCAGLKRSEIKLVTHAMIWNRFYSPGDPGSLPDLRKCLRFSSAQKDFGQRIRHERSRFGLRTQISFCMEPRKCEINCSSREAQV